MSILLALVLIIFAAFSRLIPHAPNFTPVISIALFGGAYLKKQYAFAVPVAALFLSDAVIGFYGLTSMAFVYGTVILIAALGLTLVNKISTGRVLALSLIGSIVFFVVTNFSVWLLPYSIYPKTYAGLVECYVAAIPFFGNTVLSTLVFSAVMFGAYEGAEKYVFKPKAIQRSAS